MNILIIITSLVTVTIARPILWVFANFKVYGQENLKKLDRRVIFILNHTSRADEFLFSTGIPYRYLHKIFQCRFATHHYYYNNPWLKPFLKFLGGFPIYPKTGNIEHVLKMAVELSKDSNIRSMVIFPEGSIRRGDEATLARPGAAYLAKEINWQIMPVKIIGTYNSTFLKFLSFKDKYALRFGVPFNYKDVAEKGDDLRKISQKMMDRVNEL